MYRPHWLQPIIAWERNLQSSFILCVMGFELLFVNEFKFQNSNHQSCQQLRRLVTWSRIISVKVANDNQQALLQYQTSILKPSQEAVHEVVDTRIPFCMTRW